MSGYAVTDLPGRVQAKIRANADTSCWEWTSAIHKGYGVASFEGRVWRAHRLTYTLLVGAIPPDLVLDHTCRIKHCVNPDHLDAVPQYENVQRGNVGGGRRSRLRGNSRLNDALVSVINAELIARGMTAGDLAAESGHSPALIAGRLRGVGSFLFTEVCDLAGALGMSPQQLIVLAEPA